MNTKAASERHQRQLMELVKLPGNEICADCTGRNPRWASWSLGIFICVQCAGVHRKMGTHISKVKSLTLDTWSREQVDKMKEIGNIKSNRVFNPDPSKNRAPTNMTEEERDSELEKFIRRKYEFRRFMDRKPPPVPMKDPRDRIPRSPSSLTSSPNISRSPSYNAHADSPLGSPEPERRPSASRPVAAASSSLAAPPSPSPQAAANGIQRAQTAPVPVGAATFSANSMKPPERSTSRPTPTLSLPNGTDPGPSSYARPASSSAISQAHSPNKPSNISSSVFDDLVEIQQGPATPQPPLQMNPWAYMQAQNLPVASPAQLPQQTGSSFGWAPSPNGSHHANTYPMASNAGAGAMGQQGLSPMYPHQTGMPFQSAFNGSNPMLQNNPYGASQQQNNPFGASPQSAGLSVSPNFAPNPFAAIAGGQPHSAQAASPGYLSPFAQAQQQQMQMMQQQQQHSPFGYQQTGAQGSPWG